MPSVDSVINKKAGKKAKTKVRSYFSEPEPKDLSKISTSSKKIEAPTTEHKLEDGSLNLEKSEKNAEHLKSEIVDLNGRLKGLEEENITLKSEIRKLREKSKNISGSFISEEVFNSLPDKTKSQIFAAKVVYENSSSKIPNSDYYAKLLYAILKESSDQKGRTTISRAEIIKRGFQPSKITQSQEVLTSLGVIEKSYANIGGTLKTVYLIKD